jgi:hypothetical protein
MTLQARMSASDNRLYNPGRDVAHNFQQVMEEVAERLEDKKAWKELSEVLKRENITDKDLGEACAAYCRYLVDSANLPQLSMLNAMDESGFFETKPAAQVAVMAMIGTVYAGIQHVGIREATLGGEGPLHDAKSLVKEAQSLLEYMRYPRWLRRVYKLFAKLKAALGVFSSR